MYYISNTPPAGGEDQQHPLLSIISTLRIVQFGVGVVKRRGVFVPTSCIRQPLLYELVGNSSLFLRGLQRGPGRSTERQEVCHHPWLNEYRYTSTSGRLPSYTPSFLTVVHRWQNSASQVLACSILLCLINSSSQLVLRSFPIRSRYRQDGSGRLGFLEAVECSC